MNFNFVYGISIFSQSPEICDTMSTKYTFIKQAVLSLEIDGKKATIMVNNHMFDQGDRGYNPIRLAELLQAFLKAFGFTATIVVLSNSVRHVDGKEFPRRLMNVSGLNKMQARNLLDRIKEFNAMFADSDTYAEFETKLAQAKPRAAATSALSAGAAAFVPTAAATAPVDTKQKSFAATASASATAPSVSTGGAAAATPIAAIRPQETDAQRLERLKKEQEEDEAAFKKRQQERADAIKKAEEAVKNHDFKSLASMIAFATSRGDEFMQELLKNLQSKMKQSAPAAAATTATALVPAAATAVPAPAPTPAASATEPTAAAPVSWEEEVAAEEAAKKTAQK